MKRNKIQHLYQIAVVKQIGLTQCKQLQKENMNNKAQTERSKVEQEATVAAAAAKAVVDTKKVFRKPLHKHSKKWYTYL